MNTSTRDRDPHALDRRKMRELGVVESLAPIVLAHGDAFARELFQTAAVDMGLRIPLREVARGRELLDQLAAKDPSSAAPGVVLLDLLLPDLDGRTVLRAIRQEPTLRELPVLALGLRSDELEVQSLREAGATGYLVQPARFDGLVSILRFAEVHWCRYVLRTGGLSGRSERGSMTRG